MQRLLPPRKTNIQIKEKRPNGRFFVGVLGTTLKARASALAKTDFEDAR